MLPAIRPTNTQSWSKLTHSAKSIPYFTKQEAFNPVGQLNPEVVIRFLNHRWDHHIFTQLVDLAHEVKLPEAIEMMFSGAPINETENRAVLHTALRDFSSQPIIVDGINIKDKIRTERKKIKTFIENIHTGALRGATDRPFKHVVNIGIGGSDLGPKFIVNALKKNYQQFIDVDFISSVDPEPLSDLLERVDLERTLFVVISKSFTTTETLINANYIKEKLQALYGDRWVRHFVGVTAVLSKAIEFGLKEEQLFELWDFVGGRFSLWGSVGLTIALAIGYGGFEELLKGAELVDGHFKSTPLDKNIPVIYALQSIWYLNFLDYQAQAIIPYNYRLRYLRSYLQQAFMESNGKRADRNGQKPDYLTSPIIWGELGNNAQHSFFQHLHQSRNLAPVDFILVKEGNRDFSEHNRQFTANYFAQLEALTEGRDRETTLKALGPMDEKTLAYHIFEGRRPVTSIEIERLSPYNLGSLIAFYEHVIFTQGIIWNIYSFDQWGIELGKSLVKKWLE